MTHPSCTLILSRQQKALTLCSLNVVIGVKQSKETCHSVTLLCVSALVTVTLQQIVSGSRWIMHARAHAQELNDAVEVLRGSGPFFQPEL